LGRSAIDVQKDRRDHCADNDPYQRDDAESLARPPPATANL
jgi:hypothetical protein